MPLGYRGATILLHRTFHDTAVIGLARASGLALARRGKDALGATTRGPGSSCSPLAEALAGTGALVRRAAAELGGQSMPAHAGVL